MREGHQLATMDVSSRSRERQMTCRRLRSLVVELVALVGSLESLNNTKATESEVRKPTRSQRIRTLFRANPTRVLGVRDVWTAFGKEISVRCVGASLGALASDRDTIERVSAGRYRLCQRSQPDVAPTNDGPPRLGMMRTGGRTEPSPWRQP